MALLQVEVTPGFSLQANTDNVSFQHHRRADGTTLRIDATVQLRVLAADGVAVVDQFEGFGQGVGMSFGFLTPQWFADAWDAYLVSKGYVEV